MGQELRLRPLSPADPPALVAILDRTGAFSAGELAVARELMDARLEKGEASGYRFAVAERDGAPVGYACWGNTPLTRHTWDLYWIGADPSVHGAGIGRALLLEAEADIAQSGGRLVVIETSSRAPYERARAFYLRNGYALAAVFEHFYADGDHKHVYTKYLRGGR
jgi:ribosomal protein S18 acetylase RimI-like enzyme